MPYIKIDYWFKRSSCIYSFQLLMNSCFFILLHLLNPLLFPFSISFRNFYYSYFYFLLRLLLKFHYTLVIQKGKICFQSLQNVLSVFSPHKFIMCYFFVQSQVQMSLNLRDIRLSTKNLHVQHQFLFPFLFPFSFICTQMT